MCIDTDLFGDIIVLKSDVLMWLDSNPIMFGRSTSQREYYVKTFEVVNKIKQAKHSGLFYKVISEMQDNIAYGEKPLDCFQTQYVITLDEKKAPCPDYWHRCDNLQCLIFKANLKRDKNKALYAKRKARR